MTTVALILAAALAVAAVLCVARPLLRDPAAVVTGGAVDHERLRLLDERDRALAALKELELDHRTGKISDEDYRELIDPVRREAAAALRALDRTGGPSTRPRAAS
ncbi:MAG: hypothetical protein IT201_10930 [Thermoleophilia bacterium]|nr:hypothetical protein [Thermoleophilia bacterium]